MKKKIIILPVSYTHLCVEESVLSSLLHAETVTGYHGRTVQCLSDLLKK